MSKPFKKFHFDANFSDAASTNTEISGGEANVETAAATKKATTPTSPNKLPPLSPQSPSAAATKSPITPGSYQFKKFNFDPSKTASGHGGSAGGETKTMKVTFGGPFKKVNLGGPVVSPKSSAAAPKSPAQPQAALGGGGRAVVSPKSPKAPQAKVKPQLMVEEKIGVQEVRAVESAPELPPTEEVDSASSKTVKDKLSMFEIGGSLQAPPKKPSAPVKLTSSQENLDNIGANLQTTLSSINTSLDTLNATSPKSPKSPSKMEPAFLEEIEKLQDPTSPKFKHDTEFFKQRRKLSGVSDSDSDGDAGGKSRHKPKVQRQSSGAFQMPKIGTGSMENISTDGIDLHSPDFGKTVFSTDLDRWQVCSFTLFWKSLSQKYTAFCVNFASRDRNSYPAWPNRIPVEINTSQRKTRLETALYATVLGRLLPLYRYTKTVYGNIQNHIFIQYMFLILPLL